MKMFFRVLVLAPLVCLADEAQRAGRTVSAFTLTNHPAEPSSAGYARDLAKALANRKQPPSALIGQMRGVTMLEFRTDHPLHEARVIVNGTCLASLPVSVQDNQTTLKLAAVVSGRQKSATIFLETLNHAGDFSTAYPPLEDARDTGPIQYFGPGKDVRLSETGWVEVYQLSASRFKGVEIVPYELKAEMR